MAEEKMIINLKSVAERKRHYETVFVISPSVADAASKEISDKNAKLVSDTNGTILRQDDWGKKRMAYMIEKHAMGHYYFFRYVGTQDTVKAFERSLKLDANILRFQTVKLSEPLSKDEISRLVERASKEQSFAPSIRGDEDDMALDGSY
ncbi:MAG: 30S ribosomal protein S6 [Deltaproteobacteria bacterium]|nr:30S ribosomal protein S6 [Deltaproteobacteria bacterium]